MRLWLSCCCSPSSPARTGAIPGPIPHGMPPMKQHQSSVTADAGAGAPKVKRTSFSDDVAAPRAEGSGMRKMNRHSSKRAKTKKDSRFDDALWAEQERSRAIMRDIDDEAGYGVGVDDISRASSTRSSRLTNSSQMWSSRRSGEAKSSRFSQALADAEGSWARRSDQSSCDQPVHQTQGQAAAERWMR